MGYVGRAAGGSHGGNRSGAVFVVALGIGLLVSSCGTGSPSAPTPAATGAPTTVAPTTTTVTTTSTTIAPTTSTTVRVSRPVSLACSASPTASGVSATEDAVTVKLSWTTPGEAGGPAVIEGGRITLKEEGLTLFDQPLSSPNPANDPPVGNGQASPWARGWEQASLCVELTPAGQPLVYLNGWAGAMTCCGIVRVYYPATVGSYLSLDRDQGRSYPSEQILGGYVVIMGNNRDWNSHFSCGACRGPIQITSFQHGEYLDATRQYLAQIQTDASQLFKAVTPPYYNALIPLAAWVADECELGNQSQAFATLDSMQANGQLSPPPGSSAENFGYTLTGSAYLSDVRTFLRQERYCA